MQQKLYFFATPALLVVFFSNIIFHFLDDIFDLFSWYDAIHHFWGGFFMAMFLTAYLWEPIKQTKRDFYRLFIISGATIFIGVIWELLEYVGTFGFGGYLPKILHFSRFIGDLDDTLQDLVLDLLGSFSLGLLMLKKLKK